MYLQFDSYCMTHSLADTPKPPPTTVTPGVSGSGCVPGSSHYGFSFMLETVVAWQARNPRQELSRYLEDLVEQVKNVIGWWA